MGRVWRGADSLHAREVSPDVTDNAPPNKLFDSDFMSEYTDCQSLYEFLVQSPWEVLSIAELATIPEHPRDAYVDDHTEFTDIDEMRWVANTTWVSKTLEP
jgi:hypothetical protein